MSNLGNKQIMANNIRYYMNIHSVSQTEICNTLGFKMPTFSDWVNAKTYPRIDKIELMANYFGVTKADLVEDHSSRSHLTQCQTKDEETLVLSCRERFQVFFTILRDALLYYIVQIYKPYIFFTILHY